jgi:hypothetical protein
MEKEDRLQEGHQKILEKFELHIEDVHAKYDGILSKGRKIKDNVRKKEESIIS